MNDEEMMSDLLTYARRKFQENGVWPFCAYIAKNGTIIAKGYYDGGASYGAAVSHGEMNAIKKACAALKSYENIASTDLFTTCEPCLACLDTALLVGVKRIIFAASHHDPEMTTFFNNHKYYPEDYAKAHPEELTLIQSNQRNEAVKLFVEATQKYAA